MATMIERVARAIDPKGWADFEAYCARKEYDDREFAEERSRAGRVQISLAQSRAAIAAMREPTEGMMACAVTSGGTKHWDYDVLNAIADDYSAMIDAALAEPQS